MGALGDFIDSITSGRGQDRSRGKQAGYGGSSNKSVGTSSLRPQLRPDDFAKQVARSQQDSGGSDGSGSDDYKRMMAAPEDYNDPQNLALLDDVPYFSGPSVRKYEPEGIFDFLKNVMFDSKKDVLTDLRLGIGSLSGTSLPGFKKTMESMGYAGLDDQDYQTMFDNFNKRTDMTNEEMKGQETDDYNRAFFDPCPEGYQTDPVTGMCVPVMGADPEPIVPTPFPDLPGGGGGGMTSPVLPLMDYTQPIDYTAPRISPPVPEGIAGIPRTPIIG